jgi:hypothetical protein
LCAAVAAATAVPPPAAAAAAVGVTDADKLRESAPADSTGAVITGAGRAAPWHKHNTIFVVNPSKVRGGAGVSLGGRGEGRIEVRETVWNAGQGGRRAQSNQGWHHHVVVDPS